MTPTESVRTRLGAAALAASLLLGAAACSDDGDEASDDSTTTVSVGATEDARLECADERGDLEDVNAAPGSTALADPAGVDIVTGVAEVTEETVDVELTMAGDIEATTQDPVFVVFRGVQAAQQGSFELQVRRGAEGQWALVVVDYLTNQGNETPLDAPVDVNGDTVSFSAPLSALPPLSATRLWAFGTRDGDTDAGVTEVADLCTPLDSD